jgi:hypothetical protein
MGEADLLWPDQTTRLTDPAILQGFASAFDMLIALVQAPEHG